MAKAKTNDDDLLNDMTDDDESILSLDEDFSDAERPELLPVGTYVGDIEKAVKKVSQRGSEYIALTIRIPPDQYPATFNADENPDGVLVYYNRLQTRDENGNFTSKAKYRLRQFCEAIDAPMGKRLNIGEWVGKQIKCKIVHGKDDDGAPNLNMSAFAAVD